jgi:hypothetical protein
VKYIKFISVTIAAVIVLFFSLALMSPSVNTIERSIAIAGNRHSVFEKFSMMSWNDNELLERNTGISDTLLQFQFISKEAQLFVNGSMQFREHGDTTFVTYINKIKLPLTMRLMSDKITERMTPEMDDALYRMKQNIEKGSPF